MQDGSKKPTPVQLITWLIPAIAALIFTTFTLIMHKGVEIGLGALLASGLYFAIRYGAHTQDTPPQ